MKPTAHKFKLEGKGTDWNVGFGFQLSAIQGETKANLEVIHLYAIPDGYKLVPIEPSEEMKRAGSVEVDLYPMAWNIYDKMIKAAPSIEEIE